MTDPVFLFDPDTDDVPVNGDGLNAGWTITLPASVKRHALGAMRLAEGDGLSLTDGRGLCVKTTLVDAQAGLVSVERVGRQPQPVTRLVLIQALAKTGHDEACGRRNWRSASQASRSSPSAGARACMAIW